MSSSVRPVSAPATAPAATPAAEAAPDSGPAGPPRPASASPLDPSAVADPYDGYRQWREFEPVHRPDGRLVMLTRHADCAAMLRDPRFGHAESDEMAGADNEAEPAGSWRREPRAPLTDENGRPVRSFLGLNPPDHTRLRRLVSKAFTPRMISRLAPRIEAVTAELLTEMLERDEADLIGSLASPLPVVVISELLNVPLADRERFEGWSHAMARGLDPDFLLPDDVREQQAQARAEFVEYFRDLIALRRRNPEEDLLSALTGVCDEGDDRLTENELLATCILLLIAGHETTVNLIGNGSLALLRHPGQYARLRAEPGLLDGAVEELLRYDSPVQLTVRNALEDAEIGEVAVPQGTFVVALIGAANRDPEAYAAPETLDIGREPTRHLAFGQGIHFCLGAPLARLEGQIAFRELARRAPELSLAGEVEWKSNIVLRGLARLPVRTGVTRR